MPEGRGIFAELTVWENLRMGAYMRRGRPDFKTVLDYFPWLDARRNQQAGTLSGGEQQMLALARAFLQRPRLLMLDEPSLGLAPLITREVFRVVGDLNQKEGPRGARRRAERRDRALRRAPRLRARDGLDRALRHGRRAEGERRDPDAPYLGLLMQQFLQTLVSGLAHGSIYGSLALALVLIYKATEVINFAQGEMAMFTTYIAWSLIDAPRLLLLARRSSLTLVIAFVGGAGAAAQSSSGRSNARAC